MSRELPIGFKVPMVKGILEDRKHQTRRGLGIKDFPHSKVIDFERVAFDKGTSRSIYEMRDAHGGHVYIPKGKHLQTPHYSPRYAVGDRLYVQEQWRTFVSLDPLTEENRPINLLTGRKGAGILYVAGGSMAVSNGPPRSWSYGGVVDREDAYGKVRQGMHLPRWGSRLTLTVTDVRVERLQDISEADAIAEGIEPVYDYRSPGETHWKDYEDSPHAVVPFLSPIKSYSSLWTAINGVGSWEKNPWVVAYTFTHEACNIDEQVLF